MRRRVGQYDADPVIAIEHAGELLVEAADAQVEIGEHLLGGEVEGVDVVLAVIEEVADLFERCRRARRFDFVAGDRRPIGLQLAGHRNEAPVHPDHRLADGGHPGDKFRDLCLADAVERAVDERDVDLVAQLPAFALIVIGGNLFKFSTEQIDAERKLRATQALAGFFPPAEARAES